MNKEYFITVLKYDNWANGEIGKSLVEFENIPSRCKILFHHIAAASEVWLSRVINSKRNYKNLFEESDPKENIKVLDDLTIKWINLVKKETDFKRIIEYKTTKGIDFKNSLDDILTHLFAHGNYHRGQINQLLSQNGLQPPAIDYIFYKRE